MGSIRNLAMSFSGKKTYLRDCRFAAILKQNYAQMTNSSYFSDREKGERSRTDEKISNHVWGGLYGLIQGRINDGSFGYKFPIMCPDDRGPYGTDPDAFWRVAKAEIPDLPELVHDQDIPDMYAILDLLQFSARAVAQPTQRNYHDFFGHYHLSFNRDAGLANFVSNVNLIFARNGIAFELTSEGSIQRLGPPGLREELRQAVFHTGDDETDQLLEESRRRILLPHPTDRFDAIEKIWDAFERIKTLESGRNKKEKAERLMERAITPSTPKFGEQIKTEARELTSIGNTMRIRHSETDRESLDSLEQVDYLFHRMFSFLLFVLRKTQRVT